MKLTDFITVVENFAPLCLAACWDNSGMQVATSRTEVSHVAVMLDPTPASIAKALEIQADFILSHHPLSMKPVYPAEQGNYFTVLSSLIKKDTGLYSAHTTLDSNMAGPVSWLGKKLGLVNMQVLEQSENLPAPDANPRQFGFGFHGRLPNTLGYTEFTKLLSEKSGKSDWVTCGKLPETVRTVACCPGSGGSMIHLAEKCGADIFITGDIKYHSALESNIRVIDIGHFQLEEEMMKFFTQELLAEIDKMMLPKIKISFIPAVDPLKLEQI